MRLRRKTFEFEHPDAPMPLRIRAYTKRGAWKKVYKKMVRHLYGPAPFVYDPQPISEAMDEMVCVDRGDQ